MYEDIYKHKGPLSGIHSGLIHSKTEKIFFISCDLPLMSEEMIKYIVEFESKKPAKYCSVSNYHHYLAGIYPKSLLPEIEKVFLLYKKSSTKKEQFYSVKYLIDKVGAEVINPVGLSFYNDDLFFNLNSPGDFDYIKKKFLCWRNQDSNSEMKKILLYTGPVKSGKSSRLLSFVQNKKDIGGILSIVIDKKKYLYNISSGEKRLLEAEPADSEMEIINVGSFTFKKNISWKICARYENSTCLSNKGNI